MRTSLEWSESEPEEEHLVPQNLEKKKKKIIQAFNRLTLRIWFMATTVCREKVETHWLETALQTEEPQEQAHTPHVPTKGKTKRRWM